MKTLDQLIIAGEGKPNTNVTFSDMLPVYEYTKRALNPAVPVQPSQITVGSPVVNNGNMLIPVDYGYVSAGRFLNYGRVENHGRMLVI